MNINNLKFDSIDSAASYLWGLPSHGGFQSIEKAKESAIDMAESGVISVPGYEIVDTNTDMSGTIYTNASKINQPTGNADFLNIGSVNELEDKTAGTMYVVNTDIGRGNEDFILTYQDDGSFTLTATSDGKEIPYSLAPSDSSIKVYNINAYRTKADNYSTLSSETSDSTLTARLNGIGSIDRPDIHDIYMHNTHITQRSDLLDLPLVETGGSDNRTYSSFEAATKRYMTLTGESEVIAKEEVQKAIDSGAISISDSGDYSYETSLTREEAIQKLTNSGQWLRQDAEIYVDAYAKEHNITYNTILKDKYLS